MSFGENTVDQKAILNSLEHELNENSLANAYLFTGPPGSGRSVIAREFANALLCASNNACGECESCKAFNSQTHPDLIEIVPSKSEIVVSDIRALNDKVSTIPSKSNNRVILIEEADRMNTAAANAFLKMLEEPPARTIFLLCSPTVLDLLPTIASRCRVKSLKTPSASEIFKYLKAELNFSTPEEDERLKKAIKLSNSHIGIAKNLAQNDVLLDERLEISQSCFQVHKMSDAIVVAKRIISNVKAVADEIAQKETAVQEQNLRNKFSLSEGEKVDPKLAVYFAQLAQDAQNRKKRIIEDRLSLALVDILMVYRDIALIQNGLSPNDIINTSLLKQIESFASALTKLEVIWRVDSILNAIEKILNTNTDHLLIFEALYGSLILPTRALTR